MTQTIRFTDNYDITGINPGSNVTVTGHTLFVNANLLIAGTTTNASTVNSSTISNYLILNDGETGPGVSLGTAGIRVDRGSLPDVTIRWNEGSDRWELTTDGTTYSPLNTLDQVTLNTEAAPSLGGNLNIAGYAIYDSTSTVIALDDGIKVKHGATPSASVGYSSLYAGVPSGGGSGLFVVNSATASDELVTKTKAIVYALIM